jgi:purine-nucleoside phosphorylase
MTTNEISSQPDLNRRAEEAAAVLRPPSSLAPKVAVVLGSGLNELAGQIVEARTVPYDQIPHFPRTTVAGHEGMVLFGKLNGVDVVMFQGRFHYYEGHDLETVTFPIRVLQKLGVPNLILTAATGGIRADLRAGNLVVLTDHLNLIGANPLRGLNDPRLGTRFPDMTEVYSRRLRTIAKEEAKRLGF